MKIFTGIAVVVACALWGVWFSATSANSAVAATQDKKHSVTLNWNPSNSPVAGYNVYRSDISGRRYVKLNAAPVRGLAYGDDTVQSGKTYYYVTRAVDGKGRDGILAAREHLLAFEVGQPEGAVGEIDKAPIGMDMDRARGLPQLR